MGLIFDTVIKTYDMSQIRKSDLVYVKCSAWSEGIAGFVSSVSSERITIQYHPGISNVTNHVVISAADLDSGAYEFRWSHDLSEVFEYGKEMV